MQRIIQTHITNVAGHYKGQCYAWDVVNEAFEDDGKFRQSPSTSRPTAPQPGWPNRAHREEVSAQLTHLSASVPRHGRRLHRRGLQGGRPGRPRCQAVLQRFQHRAVLQRQDQRHAGVAADSSRRRCPRRRRRHAGPLARRQVASKRELKETMARFSEFVSEVAPTPRSTSGTRRCPRPPPTASSGQGLSGKSCPPASRRQSASASPCGTLPTRCGN